MDTIKKGRFSKMNKIFKRPKKYDLRITSKDSELWKIPILDKYLGHKWRNQFLTGQMLGRYQPFHYGHEMLFYEILKKKSASSYNGKRCI